VSTAKSSQGNAPLGLFVHSTHGLHFGHKSRSACFSTRKHELHRQALGVFPLCRIYCATFCPVELLSTCEKASACLIRMRIGIRPGKLKDASVNEHREHVHSVPRFPWMMPKGPPCQQHRRACLWEEPPESLWGASMVVSFPVCFVLFCFALFLFTIVQCRGVDLLCDSLSVCLSASGCLDCSVQIRQTVFLRACTVDKGSHLQWWCWRLACIAAEVGTAPEISAGNNVLQLCSASASAFVSAG